jgi:hypothetical protein
VTVFVIRNGVLVEKAEMPFVLGSSLPMPHVSRMTSFESPVTGKTISSWRQRDRDMVAVDAVDRRDMPKAVFEKRRRIVERNGRSDQSG